MAEPSGTPLSRRQKVMLRMMADGKGRNDIATELQISPQTVRTRVEQIKQRVGVPVGADINELLRVARERGFLDEPSNRAPRIPDRAVRRPRRR
jgi:DNA-binding NarL/FixJ family response regulator